MRLHRFASILALATALVLTGCGGGGGSDEVTDAPAFAGECSVPAQKSWLAGYMDEWYFWTSLSPRPAEAGFAGVADYFDALLYTGSSPSFPADRWSGSESTASHNRFFGEGQSLGYGVSVAGLEVAGQASQPLYVRFVEAQSPAAAAGVRRGDQVLSLNGRPASELIAANDFGVLTASAAGQTLALLLRSPDGSERAVDVAAAVFALTPLAQDQIVTTPGGRRLGYVVVKDMLSQLTDPLGAAFARLRSAGAEAVVLDLRYNGGGLVSVGGTLASYLAGPAVSGQVYASLLYNERRAASNNSVFRFAAPAQALSAARVYVLTGQRTCSASEQLINGLRGVGLEVVTIGSTSCGKPVGFVPAARCGTTYSAVNFESVNARGQGRYFEGLAATCNMAEDFRQPLGATAEPLLAAALRHADTGACPAVAEGQVQALSARGLADARAARRGRVDEGDAGPAGMLGR
jgi:carboxyl-terminal processing protease